jgi:dihydropteridine reductase
VLVNPNDDWVKQESTVKTGVAGFLEGEKIDAVLNMAGGWAGGAADSADFIKNADLMWKQSVWSSGISAALAAHHLKPGGCIVLPGAKPAIGGTPGMIGYGMAKAAVHQLVKSLASPKSGLPEGAFCAGLLPITLDTPMNRKFMPKADTSNWRVFILLFLFIIQLILYL